MTEDVPEWRTECGFKTQGKWGTEFSVRSLEASDEMLSKDPKPLT